MSVLESVAKTTRQVIDSSLGTDDWDLTGLGILKTAINFEVPLWVPLNIALTREKIAFDTIALQARTISSAIIHNKIVNMKLDEANSMLDELLTANSEGCFVFPSPERLKKIKDVLALNNSIPIGEKQNVKSQ